MTTPNADTADTVELSEVIAFLQGEGPLQGVWFGEKPEGERGNFWWRKHLRAAMRSAVPSGAAETLVHDIKAAIRELAGGDEYPDLMAAIDQLAAAPAPPAAGVSHGEAVEELRRKAAAYDAINTPEIAEFLSAVENEALHQRERWGSDHDAGKTDADWFWLVGHLAGKALLKPEKALHHIITTAAAMLNWHAHKIGAHQRMRPGIGPDKQPPKTEEPK